MKKHLLSFLLATAALMSVSPAIAALGGPDSYGYTWKDSNEPGGPFFNWIEIATPEGGGGTYSSVLNCDDCHEAGISLGFNFPFYAGVYNQLSIGSNGTVYFENSYLGLSNNCLPGTPSYAMTQYNFIAHLWDDLDPSSQGGVYTQAFANYFVIEFYDIVPCCGMGDGDTWQIILFKNGNILIQYKELSNAGVNGSCVVGIQDSPTVGLEYICNGTGYSLTSDLAILFSPPTFSCNSISQNILGPNTSLCSGSPLTLSTGSTAIAQTWSNSATTPTITVNLAGEYSVIVLDTNGCTLRDTITLVANAGPTVNLGGNISACGPVVLNAGNPGSTYVWSNSSITQTIVAVSSGTYGVIVTNTATGCSAQDQLMVTINTAPTVNLGPPIVQCGGTATLSAGNNGLTYLWSNAATTQTISVSSSAVISVTVSNPNCSTTGTINVTINPIPVVNLSLTNATLCVGEGNTALSGGSPAGGSYSGTGVTAGAFNPTSAGVGTYTIIYSYTDNNNCSNSSVQALRVEACTGLVENSFDQTMIYPNPVSTDLVIQINTSAAQVEILNSLGQVVLVKQINHNETKFDMTSVENGIYFIRISQAGKQKIEKIIVSH